MIRTYAGSKRGTPPARNRGRVSSPVPVLIGPYAPTTERGRAQPAAPWYDGQRLGRLIHRGRPLSPCTPVHITAEGARVPARASLNECSGLHKTRLIHRIEQWPQHGHGRMPENLTGEIPNGITADMVTSIRDLSRLDGLDRPRVAHSSFVDDSEGRFEEKHATRRARGHGTAHLGARTDISGQTFEEREPVSTSIRAIFSGLSPQNEGGTSRSESFR